MENNAPIIRIGVLVQKCTCPDRAKKCTCGSKGPVFIDPEAHEQFVRNMFEALKQD